MFLANFHLLLGHCKLRAGLRKNFGWFFKISFKRGEIVSKTSLFMFNDIVFHHNRQTRVQIRWILISKNSNFIFLKKSRFNRIQIFSGRFVLSYLNGNSIIRFILIGFVAIFPRTFKLKNISEKWDFVKNEHFDHSIKYAWITFGIGISYT